MNNFNKYQAYKDSENEWIGKIPSHWDSLLLNFAFKENKEKNKGLIESNILSLSYGELISKKGQENFGLIPESFDTYQVINPDYLVFRFTDLQNDQKSLRVGHAKSRGIITSAYLGLIPRDNLIHSKYFYYLFHSLDIKKYFYSFGGGVRLSLDWNTLKKNKYPLPPLPEQTAIANFLDKKTAEIKEFIALKEKTIELLKERKMAIINQAVTKGLDPTVEMKDSGIEWLGKIPKHWEVKKLKYVTKFVKTGTTPSSKNKDYFIDGCVEWFTPGDFKGILLTNSNRKTSFDAIVDKEIKMFEENSIYLIGIGGTLGKVGMSKELASANQQINVTKFKNNAVMDEFGLYQLQNIGDELIKWVNFTTLPIFTQSQQKELIISYPEVEEQIEIVNFIKQSNVEINQIISSIENEILVIKEYQQSLISEVVTGKVDVTSFSDKE